MVVERHPVQHTISRWVSFLLVLLLALTFPLRVSKAQFRADSTRRQLERMVGDIWNVWSSPAHTTASDLEGAMVIAGATGAAMTVDERLQHWINDNPNAWPVAILHPLREGARYPAYELGSGQYLLPISAALYLAGSMSKSQGLRDAGLGCATAHLTTAGVRGLLFLLVQRDRPRTSPDDAFIFDVPGTRDWNKHSFFSGHIANSMGCASFLSHRFSLHAAEPVIYGYVIAIGAGRVVDGRHWFSDTVFGALFGYVVGRTISERMLGREQTSKTPSGTPLVISFSVPME